MKRGIALIVQYDLKTGEFIAQLLQELGYDTAVATTYAEALACFGARSPELLVIDPVLADGDGFDLVRLATPSAHVVVTSAFPARTADTAARLGVPLVVKPFEADKLIAHIS
jgi:DNA-binding response OmpR family regulator